MCFNVENINEPLVKIRKVFFEGTTALSRGQALCYNRDYGTATASEGSRDRRVELPGQGNQLWFAGVAMYDYVANAAGQWIDIAEPGSVVEVIADATVSAIGLISGFIASHSSANADVGKFSASYSNGRGVGSVEFLQTRTGSGLVLARLLEGPQVGGVEAFTAAATLALSPFGTSVIARASGVQTNNGLTLADGTQIGQTKRIVITGGTSDATHLNLGADKGKRPPHDVAGALAIEGVTWDRFVSGTSGTDRWTQVWDGEFWRVTLTNAAQSKFTNV